MQRIINNRGIVNKIIVIIIIVVVLFAGCIFAIFDGIIKMIKTASTVGEAIGRITNSYGKRFPYLAWKVL